MKIKELKFVGLFDSYLVVIKMNDLVLLTSEAWFGKRKAYVFNSIGHYGNAVINPDFHWYNKEWISEEMEIEILRKNISLSEGERLYEEFWRYRPRKTAAQTERVGDE